MRKLVLLLLLALPLAAQNFGKPFPLTNIRYGATFAYNARLVANGRDFFVFWNDRDHLWMARVDESDRDPRPGVLLASLKTESIFDVVWTGAHFLVAYESDAGTVVRLFDEAGNAQSEPRLLAPKLTRPHLAFNGRTALLGGYDAQRKTGQAIALTPEGRPLCAAETIDSEAWVQSMASDGDGFAAVLFRMRTENISDLSLAVFDAEGRLASTRLLQGFSLRAFAEIAGSGSGYLVARCSYPYGCEATSLDAAGNTMAKLTIATPDADTFVSRPAVVWDGSGWTMTYLRFAQNGTAAQHVIRLDPAAQSILSDDQTGDRRTAALGAMGSRVRMAWHDRAILESAELPLREEAIRPVAYVAAAQRAITTVTTRDAMLILWNENRDGRTWLHAGIHRRSGAWIERELASANLYASFGAHAATDGRNFVIAWNDSVVSLTSWGWQRWSVTAPFTVSKMAWNGSVYGVIGARNGNYADQAVATMTPSGRFSKPVPVIDDRLYSDLASDGHGFLGIISGGCLLSECGKFAAAVRLGPDMQRLDEPPVKLTDRAFAFPDVVWDGSDYVVTWLDLGCTVARIPPSSALPYSIEVHHDLHCGSKPVRIGTRLAFAWIESQGRGHMALLSPDGSVTHSTLPSPAELTMLPGDRLALLRQPAIDDAPYYGMERLTMQIADPATGKPAPPSIVAVTGNTIIWTPPPQPVTGYRIEYRIGDAPWKELDAWISGSARSFEVPIPADLFRMRAWNEGGVSEYSP